MVWLVSLFNGITTLFRLFNAKPILLEEQLLYNLTHSWEDKGVHTFPKGICPKVNVIVRLEYQLACPRGVMVKAMNCGIVVREFVLQSRYYVHFRANTLGKGMNPLILPPAMGK